MCDISSTGLLIDYKIQIRILKQVVPSTDQHARQYETGVCSVFGARKHISRAGPGLKEIQAPGSTRLGSGIPDTAAVISMEL